eukprot:UN06263
MFYLLNFHQVVSLPFPFPSWITISINQTAIVRSHSIF